jgi:hypothetical protein
LIERVVRNDEVDGLIPFRSTIFPRIMRKRVSAIAWSEWNLGDGSRDDPDREIWRRGVF